MAKGYVARLEIGLNCEWTKALVAEYVADNGLDANPQVVATTLARNLEGFQLMEKALSGPEQLTALNVLKVFEVDKSRKRFRSIKNWLSTKKGLDFQSSAVDWYWHERNVREKLES